MCMRDVYNFGDTRTQVMARGITGTVRLVVSTIA